MSQSKESKVYSLAEVKMMEELNIEEAFATMYEPIKAAVGENDLLAAYIACRAYSKAVLSNYIKNSPNIKNNKEG